MKDSSSRSDTFRLVGECGLSISEMGDTGEKGIDGECGLCIVLVVGECGECGLGKLMDSRFGSIMLELAVLIWWGSWLWALCPAGGPAGVWGTEGKASNMSLSNNGEVAAEDVADSGRDIQDDGRSGAVEKGRGTKVDPGVSRFKRGTGGAFKVSRLFDEKDRSFKDLDLTGDDGVKSDRLGEAGITIGRIGTGGITGGSAITCTRSEN